MHKLPPHWSTLYELSKIEDKVIDAAVADGRISPKMQREHAVALRKPPPTSSTPHEKTESNDTTKPEAGADSPTMPPTDAEESAAERKALYAKIDDGDTGTSSGCDVDLKADLTEKPAASAEAVPSSNGESTSTPVSDDNTEETRKATAAAKPVLSLKTWHAGDEAVRVEITQSEDVSAILGRMAEKQKSAIFDRLVALQMKQANLASKSMDDLLKSITGTFWYMASQVDSVKIVEALTVINGKLAKRQLTAKDIKFVAAKRERGPSPAAMAAVQAARAKNAQRKKHQSRK